MKTDAPKGITGAPNQDNIQKWDAVIFGFVVFFFFLFLIFKKDLRNPFGKVVLLN